MVDINLQTVRTFFHLFMELQVKHEYAKHVHPPTPEEISKTLEKHRKLGFPGAISMFDGVKWEWSNCAQPIRLQTQVRRAILRGYSMPPVTSIVSSIACAARIRARATT